MSHPVLHGFIINEFYNEFYKPTLPPPLNYVYNTRFDFTDKKAYFAKSDKSLSVQHRFFEPQDTKLKSYQEKIHLFLDVIKIGILPGLLTDYHINTLTQNPFPIYITIDLPMFESVCFELCPVHLNHIIGFRGEIICKRHSREKNI